MIRTLRTMSCSCDDVCDSCPEGTFAGADSKCVDCPPGTFTASNNCMKACLSCRRCSSHNHQRTLEECTARTDTVCACVSGYFCVQSECKLCRHVTHCPAGEGVKVQSTRTNNTVCAPCGAGTYSNTSDFSSPCRPHTRCEDVGRVLTAAGTATGDAVCGDFKSMCAWTLPAGLWVGLVLTLLLALVLACRRRRRAAGGTEVLAQLVEAVPVAPQVWTSCQESCEDSVKVPLFDPGDPNTSVSEHERFRSGGHNVLVSVVTSGDLRAELDPGATTGSLVLPRMTSEPLEDEWKDS